MKIIIIGAGQVGGTLALQLAYERNDITVIDLDAARLLDLSERIDIRTLCGSGSYPSVLYDAGAENADMLIAVTDSDEVNMIACQIAFTLFRTPRKIARVRNLSYSAYSELFNNQALAVDFPICPEQLVTNSIINLIEQPDALQVLEFAGGSVNLVAVKAVTGGPLVGHQLSTLKTELPHIDMKVAAIWRKGLPITPKKDTIIEHDDEVFFIAAPNHISAIMSELRKIDKPYKKIIIAGGGNIGSRLAKALEGELQVKIIEHNMQTCEELAQTLNNTVVLQGDAADKELLLDEGIEDTDVFCALMNKDETNIMSAILAKRLGARKVMALVNRPQYAELIEGTEIDIAIIPQQITTSRLLTYIRKGDVVNVHSLRRGAAEAIEAVAHGTPQTSMVVGRRSVDIKLPQGCTIGAVIRQDEVIIGDDELIIESNDHIILFLIDKKQVVKLEKLFQVELSQL